MGVIVEVMVAVLVMLVCRTGAYWFSCFLLLDEALKTPNDDDILWLSIPKTVSPM